MDQAKIQALEKQLGYKINNRKELYTSPNTLNFLKR